MDYRERWELKDYLSGQTLVSRIRLFQIALILLLLGFLLNFWYLQGVHGEEYAHLAENNRLRRLPSLPTRGTIFDRTETALAATRPSLDLILLREDTADLESQLERLVPILGTSLDELRERVARADRQPAFEPLVLREDVKLTELARIEARRELFPALQVRETARRSYVHRDVLAHVIGYVGEVGDSELERAGGLQLGDIVGKTGLERGYDAWLRGERGWDLVSVNNVGRRIGAAWVGKEPLHGNPLQLTVDLRLQRELREALGDETGAGVFMDPRTGEVLALVSTPAFDPNLFADGMTADAWKSITEDPRRPLQDRAIASYYAPGSVFKVVMAVTGLETDAISPDKVVYCGGSTRIYGRQRLCWKRGGHGNVDLQRALAESCNVYFYLLGKELDIGAIHEYGARFRLGRPTGIDLPGEAGGILPSRAWKREHLGEPWYPGDTISIAIGQGLLAVTPVQMATMISAVATAGRVPTPHLVRGDAAPAARLDFHPRTFAMVRRALEQAVESGTGRAADLGDIRVAGKTGRLRSSATPRESTPTSYRRTSETTPGSSATPLPSGRRSPLPWSSSTAATAAPPQPRSRVGCWRSTLKKSARPRRTPGAAPRGPTRQAAPGDQVYVRRKLGSLDLPLLGATLALVSLGTLAVASATLEGPGTEGLWRTQLVWLLIALVGVAVVATVDYRLWAGTAFLLHGGVILALVVVLFAGREVGGNRSWLDLGLVRIQPSEIAKWTTCLVLALYLARSVRENLGLRQILVIGALTGLPVVLIALQPDMGTALIFVPIFLAALLMGGVRWKVILIVLLAGLLLAPVLWLTLEDYQQERILTVFDPGRDPSGYGYQVRQSKIAIGSGGLVGKGLFQGTQSQLNFLPAQHTDFILSVLAEELGYLGVLGALGLFYLLFYRGIVAALSSQDRLGTYICMLVVAWIAGQMAVNVGMVLGRLPTIGVPLPLMSYGGSSLVSTLAGIALILNVRSRRFVN